MTVYDKIYIRVLKPFFIIRLAMGLILTGCVGAGGSIGVRTGLQGDAQKHEHKIGRAYGGVTLDAPIAFDKVPVVEGKKTFASVGVELRMLFSYREIFYTFLPYVAVATSDSFTLLGSFDPLIGYGGLLGAGWEFGEGRNGFHSQLCGGVYTVSQALLCGRISSRNGGWIGTDVNLNIPTFLTVSDAIEISNSGGKGIGWGS